MENVPIGVSEDLAANVGEKRKFIDAKLDEPNEWDGAHKDT